MEYTENYDRIINKFKDTLNNFIEERIKESKEFLLENGTTLDEVLNCKDTEGYSEESENNNFEAGVISGLIELQEKFLNKE